MLDSYKKITNSLVNWISHIRSGNRGLDQTFVSRAVQSKFLEAVKYAGSKSFVLDSLGEISLRVSPSYILTVGPNTQMQNIEAADITVHLVNKDLILRGPELSSHIELHKQIYNHSDSGAVLLCHPHAVYVLFHKKLVPDYSLFPEIQQKSKGFKVVSSDELVIEINHCRLLLVPEVGLFSHAADLMEAIHQVEILEWICSLNLALAQ